MNRFLIPFFVFLILVVFLGVGLTLNPRDVPSPFIGKAAPEFSLPLLHQPEKTFDSKTMRGKVWILNVWASWCVSCRAEHQVLNQLIQMKKINLVGLNYKNEPDEARAWLKQFGNPYLLSVIDFEGKVGIDWGVYAVPETFIIDQQGIVKFKHIGPVTHQLVKEKILPLLSSLENSNKAVQ